MKRNPECELCSLHETAIYNRCVWGRGGRHAKIFGIGEAPGYQEDVEGKAFVGQAGLCLEHVIRRLGLTWDHVYVSNVLRCRPRDNKLPGVKEMKECFEKCGPYLKHELDTIKPKAIVLFGATPLYLLTRQRLVSKFEGMEVPSVHKKIRTFAAYHPAFILRRPSMEVRLAMALAQAAKAAGVKVKPKGWEGGMFEYELRT